MKAISFLLASAFRRLALRCHGDPALPPLVCVPGLTRNAHDFDVLAQALSDIRHVIAVDLPGRGASDWLDDPRLYGTATYVQALSHLLAALGRPVDYLGTSLGGICGMEIAAARQAPIRKLVLNDIGPFVPRAALQRIKDYLCAPMPHFADVDSVRRYLRRVHAPFGPLTAAQWRRLARTSCRDLPDGSVALHYDPAIAEPYAAAEMRDLDLSAWWHAIEAPLLTLRGQSSDVLPEPVYHRMLEKSAGLTVTGAGHAPALQDPPTIAAIRAFLVQPKA